MLEATLIGLLARYGITDYQCEGYWSESAEYFYVIVRWYHYTNRQMAGLTICHYSHTSYERDIKIWEWRLDECRNGLDHVVEMYGHAQMEQSYSYVTNT